VYIPKADGRQRPLGIAALEDKIVQQAVVTILNCIYEERFRGFSYGFRPLRSAHHALDALAVGINTQRVSWVLDADIQGFFDNIDQEWLIRFLEHEIADRRILRLIRKWLKAGVSEGGEWSETKVGTPQGGPLTPRTQKITCAGRRIRRHGSRSRRPIRPRPRVRRWNRMSNRDRLLPDEDFLDQKPQDLLAFADLQAIRPRPEPFAKLSQRLHQTQIPRLVRRGLCQRKQFGLQRLFLTA
jgi:retron-type reverse transcriptase